MNFLQQIVIACVLTLSAVNGIFAAPAVTNYYRNFWLPSYHGLRLDYCSFGSKKCGMAVANEYCQMMGYAHADQHLIDYNIGLTNIIATKAKCKGWHCNGFKTIRCVANFSHKPPAIYYFRLRKFFYPRFKHYRVAWCYDGQKGCGKRAAFSFCRRMGYLQAPHFAIEKQIAATKAIGNQKLCFGGGCNAFAYITCYR